MSMRYAGFMAGAREDRLLREQREEEQRKSEESWQRQIERDEAAHQRQLDLLDIRQKNALKLQGIAASRAQKKEDAKLKRKVDALIVTQGLPDTPKVRAEITAGVTLLGADAFMEGVQSGKIRINASSIPNGPSSEVAVDTTVSAATVDPVSVDTSNSPSTAPVVEAPTVEPSGNPNGDAAAAQFDGAVYDMENKTFADAGNPPEGMVWDNNKRTFVPADDTTAMLNEPAETPSVDQQTEEGLGSPPADERVVSYNNLPYLKIESVAGMEAAQIEQYIRMQKQRGYSDDDLKPFREELEFVKKAEQEPETAFDELIGDADTFGKLNSLQANLDTQLGNNELSQDEFDTKSALITKSVDRLMDIRRRDAEKEGGSFMFFPITSTGTIGADGQMVTVRDGKYLDATGQEIDITQGKLLPPENYETFVRNYNVQSQKIATTVSEGVTAVQSLSNYRQLVIDSPAGLNNYISVAGKLVAEANSIKSALEGISSGQYGYEAFENRVMSAIRDLSEDDARIARAQLRAAYAMASFAGSTGQALSDRELIANLKAVGQGLTDPRKVVALINDNINDVVTMTEQKRSTSFNSFIASDALKETMSQTPIGMPFENYISEGVFDEGTRRQYLDALAGKTDYAYNAGGENGAPSISSMTFDEFKDYVNSQPYNPNDENDTRTVGSMYSEDELREYFKRNGGQL